MSPNINLRVNNKVLRATVDTGSGYTLIKESALETIGQKINTRRTPPLLQGVTGAPLRILGMVKVEIEIGGGKKILQWYPVVPNKYLEADILLGCDLLGQATVTWDNKRGIMFWDDTPYVVNQTKRNIKKVSKVHQVPTHEISPVTVTNNYFQTHQNITVPPYTSIFCEMKVKGTPGEDLIIYPQGRLTHNSHPFVTRIDDNSVIKVPVVNNSKKPIVHRVGTIIGRYEKGKVEKELNTPLELYNDLLPQSDQPQVFGSRKDKLKELINQLDWDYLTDKQKKQLEHLIYNHDELFILGKDELGLLKVPPVKISVADPQPSRGPMYRYPEKAKELIAEMLEDMERKGVIEKSTSAWLSPIVLVSKPDGSKRVCLDYRHVNKHLSTDIYPLPRLDELVEQAAGNQYYVTLDLKEAYFQILLHEESRDLTAFSDGVSLYRFRRLPFGLSCAPAVFSRQIASVLTPLIRQGWVKNYLDDIIMWADDFPTLLERLNKLFDCLAENGIKLNISKCAFAQREVTFLGHRVSADGCRPDPTNVQAISKMKPPKTVKEVRRFLGMCGFYRKHIPNYAKIATPLTNLTRATVEFHWSKDCDNAFNILKEKLKEEPVLVKAQIDQPFILTTDASQTHVGAVLSQEQPDGNYKPIGYFSKKLNPTENRYSVTDKEALGVVLACRNFHHYLWGTTFTIYTDHQPLTSIFKKKTKSPRMSRWILEMREYQYNIKYLKGKYNLVADPLSRPVRIVQRQPEGSLLGKTPEEIRDLQRQERKWKEMAEYLEGGRIPTSKYHKSTLDQFALINEILYFARKQLDGSIHYCLIVPQTLKLKAMELAHVTSGHLGQKKTISKAEEMFYWCNLKVDVCKYVKECITCQQYKGSSGMTQKWQEMPPVSKPLERIGIDLTDMVGGTNARRYVLTVIDHYSRYVRFYPLPSKHSTQVIEALTEYIADFGAPERIVLDNGGEFTSRLFQDFCLQRNMALCYATPYHPQGNAVTERMHRTLKSLLAALCNGHPLHWPKHLTQCQQIMNTAIHTSTNTTPYFAFFGRHPSRSLGLPVVSSENDDVLEAHRLIQETQRAMTQKYRDVANRGRKNQSVSVGTLVWVKRETVVPGTSRKLNPKWTGPFRVEEVIRNGSAYILVHPITGQRLQRAADKLKVHYGSDEWILQPRSEEPEQDPDEDVEPLPPRIRRPPRRLITEC